MINYDHCVTNPNNFDGYSDVSWGITASTNYNGYSAHSPNNDLGVISPTAALSSFPYTPLESKKALENFYYNLNNELWGDYGFFERFFSVWALEMEFSADWMAEILEKDLAKVSALDSGLEKEDLARVGWA